MSTEDADGNSADGEQHECPTCGWTTDSRKSLGWHHATEHGETLLEFERREAAEQSEESHDCPQCDRTLSTERGVKIHHERVHGSSIAGVEVECSYCEETKRVRPNAVEDRERFFCGPECHANSQSERWNGEDNPAWKGGGWVPECEWCGESFEVFRNEKEDARFCSVECMGDWMSENLVGEDSRTWKGGVSKYGGGWGKRKRDLVRERDGRECRLCSMTDVEHRDQYGRKLDIHHIIPAREFDDPIKRNAKSNLISLCIPCHNKVERLTPLLPPSCGLHSG